jgi:hypothetical protein
MALNSNLKSLYNRWLDKANQYDIKKTDEVIDKFFSLYVVYNALYTEATIYLHRKAVKEGKDEYKLNDGNFPDKNAATKYVLDLLKSRSLIESLERTEYTREAINELKILFSKQHHFLIHLDPVSGEAQDHKDAELIKHLNSQSADERAKAILQLIYQVRCNMFHGRKSITTVQKQLLIPLTIILKKIIDKLYQKLEKAKD